MSQPENDGELTNEEQTMLTELLQQPRNHIIIPLTQSLIEAIFGGGMQLVDAEPSIHDDISLYSHRHRHMYDEDDSEDEAPMPKRLRLSTYGLSYFFKLSSGEEFYYTEDDSKPTLINETIEPNPIVRIIIGNMPSGIRQRLNYLGKFSFDEMEEEETDIDEDDIGNAIINMKPRQFDNVCIQVFSAYMKEMKLRAVFRRVWARWKVYRLNKISQEEIDPITLVSPVNKVIIYEPNKKYVFDANSLATWIESKLHYQEYGFAVPMYPCNPWTNVEFTYTQMISIYYQLKHHGELRWGLITLRQHDFNKQHWHLYHRSALSMKAIRSNLWALDNHDAREMLEDFIFAMIDALHLHTTTHIVHAYRQAIKKVPHHWYIEKWKALTFKHLEGEHFAQHSRTMILTASSALLKKQELFFKELVQAGII